MDLQIARDGTVIGVLQLDELGAAIAGGTVFSDDYGWHEGLVDWKPIREFLSEDASYERAICREQPKEKRDWRQAPATDKQLAYLKSFGVELHRSFTKGEASDLIEKCVNDPEARRVQEEKRFAEWTAAAEQQRELRAEQGAYSFREDVESAKKVIADLVKANADSKAVVRVKKSELAALRKQARGASGEERDALEDRIIDLDVELAGLECEPPDLTDYKEELKQCETVRVKFWKATFKDDWIDSEDASEFDVLVDVGATIYRYHEEYGRYFKVPTNKQIADILESLDNASPDWDSVQPEAFYARLHQNFPNQMRV